MANARSTCLTGVRGGYKGTWAEPQITGSGRNLGVLDVDRGAEMCPIMCLSSSTVNDSNVKLTWLNWIVFVNFGTFSCSENTGSNIIADCHSKKWDTSHLFAQKSKHHCLTATLTVGVRWPPLFRVVVRWPPWPRSSVVCAQQSL